MTKPVLLVVVIYFLINPAVGAQDNSGVTIFWDASFSMKDRNIQKEFYFLESYFKNFPVTNATLITFSNEIITKQAFKIINGDCSEVKEKLLNVNYDGATSYQQLSQYGNNGDVLIFTDGKQTLNTSIPNFENDLFIIVSKADFDRATINLLTLSNNATLVNLVQRSNNSITDLSAAKKYLGKVYQGARAVDGAEIFIKGAHDNFVISNQDGSYKIQAIAGDTIMVKYQNRIFEQTLGENPNINFFLEGGQIQLDEVVVSDKKLVSADVITAAYGKEKRDKIGYAVQSISDEDISDISTNVSRAVQGKFSGVKLGQNDDLSQITMRPSNSILGNNYGLIVIDGMPIERFKSKGVGEQDLVPRFSAPLPKGINDTSTPLSTLRTGFIDPNNIAEMTVLKGLAATNRFGSLGANGVLLITTKTAVFGRNPEERKDLARLTGNVYDGKVKVSSKTLVTPYLKELKTGNSVQDAYENYLVQRQRYTNAPGYLIDVFDFFEKSNTALAYRILSNVLEKESPKYVELRAFYLKCSAMGNKRFALLGAQKMVEFFPNKIQSYFDLANAHSNSGNFQEALNLLTGVLSGSVNQQLNFTGLNKVAATETRNLVNRERGQLQVSKVEKKYLNNVTYDARLVFEWSNSDAEFELQFVNPQKRFFTWEHTILTDEKRIKSELKNGFSTEQFEIFGAESKGEWLINVTHMGNRNQVDKQPLFLKCSIQYDFGSSTATEEIHLIRLHEIGDKQQFFKFQIE